MVAKSNRSKPARIVCPVTNVSMAYRDYLRFTRRTAALLAADWFDTVARFETVTRWHIHMAQCAATLDGFTRRGPRQVSNAEQCLADAGADWETAFCNLFEDQFAFDSLVGEWEISDTDDEILFQWAVGFIEGLQTWWSHYAKEMHTTESRCLSRMAAGAELTMSHNDASSVPAIQALTDEPEDHPWAGFHDPLDELSEEELSAQIDEWCTAFSALLAAA